MRSATPWGKGTAGGAAELLLQKSVKALLATLQILKTAVGLQSQRALKGSIHAKSSDSCSLVSPRSAAALNRMGSANGSGPHDPGSDAASGAAAAPL